MSSLSTSFQKSRIICALNTCVYVDALRVAVTWYPYRIGILDVFIYEPYEGGDSEETEVELRDDLSLEK